MPRWERWRLSGTCLLVALCLGAVPASLPAAAFDGEPVLEVVPPPPMPPLTPLPAARLSPVAQTAPVLQLPSAPRGLSLSVELQAQPLGAVPTVRLSWKAASAGTYLIKGYKLWRKKIDGSAPSPVKAGALLTRPPIEDSGELGAAYDYWLEAVDAKGNTGPGSAPVRADFGAFSPEQLAPRAPRGLSASSQRRQVLLSWQAPPTWLAPVSEYALRRSSTGTDLAAPVLAVLTMTAFTDNPPMTKTDYIYTVSARDSAGRESQLSLSATGQATGTLPPGVPRALTAKASGEKLKLGWERPVLGTAPLSAYLLRRRFADPYSPEETQWEKAVRKDLSATGHTFSSESGRLYEFELTAIDTEGIASAPATATAKVRGTQFNKTAVLLMPTAYSNHVDRDTGWNTNVLFDFYVGSLYEYFDNPKTGVTKTGIFQPLQVGTASSDIKYAFLKETLWTPGLAAGFYGTGLINFGQPNSSQTIGVSSSGGQIATLGNIYLVASKRPWVKDQRTALHIGVMRGRLADDLSRALPPAWELTVRHLTPGGDFPEILNRLLDPRLGAKINAAPNMLFAGIQFPLTVPLGFFKWRTGARVELLRPALQNFGMDLSDKERADAESLLPTMVNFRVENLPLFGFEFAMFQFQGGLQWIAFYHVPDLSWSF